MSTESVARAMIGAAESAPTETPSAPAPTSNAHEHPDVAIQEMDALVADDADNTTRRIAAALTVLHDHRPYISTRGGLVRRAFFDDGDNTRRIAREMIDASEWAKDQDRPEAAADKRAMALHDFAKATNASTMEPTLPSGGDVLEPGSDEWHGSADSIIDQIIQRGREAR